MNPHSAPVTAQMDYTYDQTPDSGFVQGAEAAVITATTSNVSTYTSLMHPPWQPKTEVVSSDHTSGEPTSVVAAAQRQDTSNHTVHDSVNHGHFNGGPDVTPTPSKHSTVDMIISQDTETPQSNGFRAYDTPTRDLASNEQDEHAQRQGESSSRTPSLHVQSASTESNGAPHSRPSSPLTEVEVESPKQDIEDTTVALEKENLVTPHAELTPRERKQVDHFINAPALRTPKSKAKSPSQPRRASTVSSTKSPFRSDSVVKTKGGPHNDMGHLGKSVAMSPSPQALAEEEDGDVKLAKALMEQEFGLRRRRGA